jgi:hypothetical protein
MYADGFEPPVTEGWQSFGLINKCTNNVRLQYPYKIAGKIALDCIFIFKFLDSEGLKKNLNELVAGIDFHLFIIAQ